MEETRACLLRRFLAVFALALLAASWRLWTPQHIFPQVPALRWIGGLPDAWQWICLASLIVSLLAAVVAPRGSAGGSWSLLLAALLMLLLMASDQHRWQPWAYQMMLTALALATLPAGRSWPLLRWLTISIYLYSGWSKCDVTFLDDLGQQFLAKLAGMLHQSSGSWSLGVRRILAGGFVAGELLIGLTLIWPQTRRAGLWAAVASHVLLLLILGPWGLGHRPPVLLWNGYFIVQDVLLFAGPLKGLIRGMPESQVPIVASTPTLERAGPAVTGILWLAILAPLLAPWGFCDHWLAWGLYASRAERVKILVPSSQERRLPAELQSYLTPLKDEPDWLELRADRWSFATLGVPLYPQNRFQLAVALAVARHDAPGVPLRVVRFSTADRWTGRRERETLVDPAAIEAACRTYWLNAQPR